MRKENKWLCENARSLERYSGQWVSFCPRAGVLSRGTSLSRVLRPSTRAAIGAPFVFHVPSRTQIGFYIPVIEQTAPNER
jgi:hypothetical protein